MSAHNAIAVLITCRRDGKPGCEYRVARVIALENVTRDPDYPSADSPILNRQVVRNYFEACEVLYDSAEARQAALKLEEEHEFVEYGIVELDYSPICFPASERGKKRRHRLRHLALFQR